MITQSTHTTSAIDGILDSAIEAHLCESCYDMIVDFGIQHVLTCLGRAARVRASDYRDHNRHEYLRCQRAASRIIAVYEQDSEDSKQIDRIVAEEARPLRLPVVIT